MIMAYEISREAVEKMANELEGEDSESSHSDEGGWRSWQQKLAIEGENKNLYILIGVQTKMMKNIGIKGQDVICLQNKNKIKS